MNLDTVLVVEDEALVALDLEDMLRDIGFHEIVICASVPKAEAALAARDFDYAVFDLNLDGQSSIPLIEKVADGPMKIVVASGYDAKSMPLKDESIPRITKPYRIHELAHALLGDEAVTAGSTAIGSSLRQFR